ncbi:MAG: amidohydrolase family protein [Nanoarchaeota archaeon]|nr:amidohydrolase family protein [Nanoarchaeota archaeon]
MILLKNGLAYIDKKILKKDILISKAKINKIADKISINKKIEVIDCSGKLILPGIIDPHVHFREPGLTHKEDFLSGSKAAAAGGITTVLDMPNNKPPILTSKDLKKKRELAKKSLVNYGFHFGSSTDNINEIKKAKNIASTKIFMNWSTGSMKIDDEKKLEHIFKNSRIVAVHAEEDKVKQAVNLAKKTKKKLYLCHISSKKEIEFLQKNKENNIFIEVTPHHLYLTEKKNNPFLSVRPCLKTKEDNEALWQAINSGLVDTIGTDHAPHTIKEKESDNPPSGMPGEETLLPLMLDAINSKKISLRRLIELCCENPAIIFGIKNKGKIKKGYDADFTIVDMNIKKRVDANNLFTKCRWSPYNNKLLKGWPVITIINGNIVYNKGKINSKSQAKEVKFS